MNIGDKIMYRSYLRQGNKYFTGTVTEVCPKFSEKGCSGEPCVKCGKKFISDSLWIDDPDELPWCEDWS